ncbi:MAG: hypothetical protein ACREJU_07330 [Nitrospiraceae bacterium]
MTTRPRSHNTFRYAQIRGWSRFSRSAPPSRGIASSGNTATFDLIAESAGVYPLVTPSLTGALRGAIAVLVASPDAKPAALMPQTP